MNSRTLNGMIILALLPMLSHCAYSLQTSKGNYLKKQGIRKIYIEPFRNSSFKPGVDITVYNILVKRLEATGRIILVENIKDCDAVLQGTVTSADFSIGPQTTANNLRPFELGPDDISIATLYTANLSISLNLKKIKKKTRKIGKTIWADGFSRSKSFPGNNQIGPLGVTSSLINQSEFERAIGDLATSMMSEFHESMMVAF